MLWTRNKHKMVCLERHTSKSENDQSFAEKIFVQNPMNNVVSSESRDTKSVPVVHYHTIITFCGGFIARLEQMHKCKNSQSYNSTDGQEAKTTTRIVASGKDGFPSFRRGTIRILRILGKRSIIGCRHIVVRVASSHVL